MEIVEILAQWKWCFYSFPKNFPFIFAYESSVRQIHLLNVQYLMEKLPGVLHYKISKFADFESIPLMEMLSKSI